MHHSIQQRLITLAGETAVTNLGFDPFSYMGTKIETAEDAHRVTRKEYACLIIQSGSELRCVSLTVDGDEVLASTTGADQPLTTAPTSEDVQDLVAAVRELTNTIKEAFHVQQVHLSSSG